MLTSVVSYPECYQRIPIKEVVRGKSYEKITMTAVSYGGSPKESIVRVYIVELSVAYLMLSISLCDALYLRYVILGDTR
jgi:hypothetical protein